MAINDKPLVSVIIATYNYGHFIEDAVDSVLAQTIGDDQVEIIVVDDGSTDDTSSRMTRYKDKVIYLRQDNRGQASAFNLGYRHARGDIIAFLDSDDYWAGNKLKIAVENLARHHLLDIFYHNLEIVDGNRKPLRPYFKALPDVTIPRKVVLSRYAMGYIREFPPTSGMTFRRACLERIMPIPEHYVICADPYLHYFSCFYAREMLFIPECLGYYRIHGMNLVSGDEIRTNQQILRTHRLIVKDLSNFGTASSLDVSCVVQTVEQILWGSQTNLDMLRVFRSDLSRKIYYLLIRIWLMLPPAVRGQKLTRLPINTAAKVLKAISKLF